MYENNGGKLDAFATNGSSPPEDGKGCNKVRHRTIQFHGRTPDRGGDSIFEVADADDAKGGE